MLTGLNHLTLAVRELERSVGFYRDVLGFRLAAQWNSGAYLELGDLWLCLSLDGTVEEHRADYTHYAFSVPLDAFAAFADKLRGAGISEWKDNRSEGDSLYFLDPDGHKLEAHVGSLASRLDHCRARPYAGLRIFD
jgi:catechol 2,3-dioxygenase-like lactoylglutathione lyase family enzyme